MKKISALLLCVLMLWTEVAAPECTTAEARGPQSSAVTAFMYFNATSNHTIVEITNVNGLLLFGDNSFGQCGKPNTERFLTEPNKMTYDSFKQYGETVSFVRAGGRHSVAYGGNIIWTWGDNTYGQLGRETENYYDYSPKPVDFSDYPDIEEFICVSAGEYHTLAIDQDYNLYAWGRNNCFQIGRDDTEYSAKPIKVAENIETAVTKFNHNLVKDKDGKLYAFGSNDCGQLGNPEITADRCAELIEIKCLSDKEIDSMAVGEHHSAAGLASHDRTYEIYGWGDNSKYQLGIDDTGITRVNEPIKIAEIPSKVQVSPRYSIGVPLYLKCGRNVTFANDYWCGTGCAVDEKYPEDVLKNFTLRECYSTTFHFGYDGGIIAKGSNMSKVDLWAYGKNDKGQLMKQPDDEWHYKELLPYASAEPAAAIPAELIDGAKIKINLCFLEWNEDFIGSLNENEESDLNDLIKLHNQNTYERIGTAGDIYTVDNKHAVLTVKLNDGIEFADDNAEIKISLASPILSVEPTFECSLNLVREDSLTPKTIEISCDSPPRSGSTDGMRITAELSGAEFRDELHPESWRLNGIDGARIADIRKTDATHAELTVAGSNSDGYSAKEITLVCDGDEYTGAMAKAEDGTLYIRTLESENSITLARRRKTSSGGSSAAKPSPTPTAAPTEDPRRALSLTIGCGAAYIDGERTTAAEAQKRLAPLNAAIIEGADGSITVAVK